MALPGLRKSTWARSACRRDRQHPIRAVAPLPLRRNPRCSRLQAWDWGLAFWTHQRSCSEPSKPLGTAWSARPVPACIDLLVTGPTLRNLFSLYGPCHSAAMQKSSIDSSRI